MEPQLSELPGSFNGVGKLIRESAAKTETPEFFAQVRYALGSIELYFGTPEGTAMNAPTGRVLRSYMRVLLSQLEYLRELHASGFTNALSTDERVELDELIERAEEMVDSLAWVAEEELNTSLREAATRAAT